LVYVMPIVNLISENAVLAELQKAAGRLTF
jgi:hypothetical protein